MPLGTGACFAYLFGYWGPLGLNVFEHIGLTDVVRLSLYPIVVSLSFLVVGMIVGNLIGPFFPPGGGQKTKFGQSVKKHEWVFWTIWAGFLVYGYIWGIEPYKWVGLAALLGLLNVPIQNTDSMIAMFPERSFRVTLVSAALLIPSMAFAHGRIHADEVISGKAKRAIDATRIDSGLNLRATARKPIMYVGRLGDRIVLYETLSEQLVLVDEETIPVLPLREK